MNLRYIKRVTDVNQWDPCFLKAFAAKMAEDLAEPLTQSETKRARAERVLSTELSTAIRVNAIALPPQKLADDEWLLSRL